MGYIYTYDLIQETALYGIQEGCMIVSLIVPLYKVIHRTFPTLLGIFTGLLCVVVMVTVCSCHGNRV